MKSEIDSIVSESTKPSLEIETKAQIIELENSQFLRNSYYNKSENIILYKMEFENKKDLEELFKKINNENYILRISKNF